MEITSLDSLRSLSDIKIERMEIPEWGATVYVRAFDAYAFSVFMNLYTEDSDSNFQMEDAANIVALCLCDKDGKRIGEGREVAEELMQHNPQALQQIYTKAIQLSGLTAEDVESAEGK